MPVRRAAFIGMLVGMLAALSGNASAAAKVIRFGKLWDGSRVINNAIVANSNGS